MRDHCLPDGPSLSLCPVLRAGGFTTLEWGLAPPAPPTQTSPPQADACGNPKFYCFLRNCLLEFNLTHSLFLISFPYP